MPPKGAVKQELQTGYDALSEGDQLKFRPWSIDSKTGGRRRAAFERRYGHGEPMVVDWTHILKGRQGSLRFPQLGVSRAEGNQ